MTADREVATAGAADHEVADLLNAVLGGQSAVEAELMESAYRELRAIAGSYFRDQNAEHTLQPTALVHEAVLKISGRRATPWEGHTHFLAVAVRAMKQILVDHARTKKTGKRGGEANRVPLSSIMEANGSPAEFLRVDNADEPDAIDFHETLNRLAAVDERRARVVELRFFAGLTIEQTAKVMGVSERTVELDWRFARAWLRRELKVSL